jgi:RecG-like helicase
MTVQQLRAPVVAGRVAAARAAVEAAAQTPTGSLDRFEVSEAIAELHALEAQVHALKLQMLAEAERRRLEEDQADTGTAAWAARLTGSTRAVMAGGLWLARLLQEKYDATRKAFAAGQIGVDQVRVVVHAAEHMPDRATAEQRRAAEEGPVGKAADGMNARRLRNAARRMLEEISKELADEQEADMLDEEDGHARRETWLTIHDNGDGTVSGRFVIPPAAGRAAPGGAGEALRTTPLVQEQAR